MFKLFVEIIRLIARIERTDVTRMPAKRYSRWIRTMDRHTKRLASNSLRLWWCRGSNQDLYESRLGLVAQLRDAVARARNARTDMRTMGA